MFPAISAVRLTGATHRTELPLLVLGPALGTSATTLWTAAATHLTDVFDVVAWDLPGHGHNRSVPDEHYSIAELATGVLRIVDDLLAERGAVGQPFFYAGDSVGGAVGLQLMLDAPDRITSAVLLCTGAQIGEPGMWAARIGQVSAAGTPAMVSGSAERWFGPGFREREPARASALLHALEGADDDGYVQVCEALAGFDVRDRLAEIGVPVLAVAGGADVATPTGKLREIADRVQNGSLVELDGVAHLAPAEAPEDVARLIRGHLLGEAFAGIDAQGSALDARSRSLARLAVMLLREREAGLADEIRRAGDDGLTEDEIDELRLLVADLA